MVNKAQIHANTVYGSVVISFTLAYTPHTSTFASGSNALGFNFRQVTDENAKKQIDLKRSQHAQIIQVPAKSLRNHMDRQVISDKH